MTENEYAQIPEKGAELPDSLRQQHTVLPQLRPGGQKPDQQERQPGNGQRPQHGQLLQPQRRQNAAGHMGKGEQQAQGRTEAE